MFHVEHSQLKLDGTTFHVERFPHTQLATFHVEHKCGNHSEHLAQLIRVATNALIILLH